MSDPITFDDERDERAWVAFASGYREAHSGGSRTEYAAAAAYADRMLVELRARRVHGGEAYR